MRRSGSAATAVVFLLVGSAPVIAQATSQPAGNAPPAFISLAELQDYYADKVRKTRQAIEAERLVALEAFLQKAPATERQQTLLAMVESAVVLERNDRVIALSEEYLKGSPSGPEAWSVRQARIAALIAEGRTDQASAEWEKASVRVDMDAWQQTFDSAILIADALLESGRTREVGELYKTLRSRFSFVSNLAQVLEPREAGLKWIGKTPPAVEGTDMQGKPVDLSQYRGKVVLIDFWATWCQPCIMALPELIETYKTHHASGFEVIGISVDTDKEALNRFLKARPLPWRILFDGKGWLNSNARRYEVTAIPATFLVDRSGRIAMVGTPSKGYGPVVKRLLQQPPEKKP